MTLTGPGNRNMAIFDTLPLSGALMPVEAIVSKLQRNNTRHYKNIVFCHPDLSELYFTDTTLKSE
jgi:hypothetical protein